MAKAFRAFKSPYGPDRRRGGASPSNPITGTGPTLAPLTHGDTLSSAVTWGSYLPGGATADRQMRVDGGAWVAYVGGTIVAEGEIWEVREVVGYGAFTRTFASAAQTVAEAPAPSVPVIVSPGSIDAQPLVGQPVLVTEPDVTGATSAAYQWYDGDPANGGVALSGLTSATFTPTATQYALAAPMWRLATYTNASGSVTEVLEAPAVVGYVWQDDFGALAVGANTAAIVAAGYTQWAQTSGQAWTGAVVANTDAPSGRGVAFSATGAANFGASPNAPAAFLSANGFDYYEELIMFVHDGTGGRFAFRGKNQASNIYVSLTNLAPGLSIRLNASHHQLPGDDPNNTAGTSMGTLTANAVYFVRHRIQGNESRLKIWLASDPEPDWSLANVRPYGSPLGTYGPGMLARTAGSSKTCLFMSCGANTPAPFWSGYTAPVNTVAPAITGSLVDGGTANLSDGTWSPVPDEIERQWTANGSVVGSGATLDLTGREGETIAAQVRARMTGGAWSAWAAATGGGVVGAATISAFTARFGVGQDSGTGAFNTAYYTDSPPADGTYGPFTVASGIITPNTTLVAGSYNVGGYPVEVLANWMAFGTLAEFAAAGSVGSYGKTCLVREGIRGVYDNGASGFLRRTDGAGTIILGDGPDVRLTALDPAYDARAHFERFYFRSTRNVTWRNLRFAPTTKVACWEPVEPSGGAIVTGNLWIDKCVAIASRPDPNGDYTGGSPSFPGAIAFYTSQTVSGLRLTDNIAIGGARGIQVRPTLWGEIVGNTSYLSYADAYTVTTDPATPFIFAANLSALNVARPSDYNNPHSDGVQVNGGNYPANCVIEACAHFSGIARGRNYTQPFFLADADYGYQAIMRDCVVSGAEIYPFTIGSTIGSRIEHCAWAPSPLDTLPANTTGGVRFGSETTHTQSGLNILRNSVFRGLSAGTINAIVTSSGNVEVQGWTLANWQAQYEDWTIGGVTYPTLQQVMAGLKSKSGIAGHRVSFTGPDASSFQIDGIVAPTLTGLTVTSTTAASAAATITTDTDLNPVFWAVVPTGTAVAAPRDIKRQLVTGAVLYGWSNVKAGDTAITLNLTGALVAGTTYDVVAMQENGWTQVSAVSRQSFTAT